MCWCVAGQKLEIADRILSPRLVARSSTRRIGYACLPSLSSPSITPDKWPWPPFSLREEEEADDESQNAIGTQSNSSLFFFCRQFHCFSQLKRKANDNPYRCIERKKPQNGIECCCWTRSVDIFPTRRAGKRARLVVR